MLSLTRHSFKPAWMISIEEDFGQHNVQHDGVLFKEVNVYTYSIILDVQKSRVLG